MKTAFQKIAEQQILVNGVWQPSCLLALSSKFPNAKYNLAPNGVVPDINSNTINNGFVFDGTDYIDCGNPTPQVNYDYTIAVRAKFANATVPSGIVNENIITKNATYALARNASTNKLIYYDGANLHYGTKNTWDINKTYVIIASININSYAFYIDGVLDGSGALGWKPGTTSWDINVGGLGSSISNTAFDGVIDDIIILRKHSTNDEVKALFKLYGGI